MLAINVMCYRDILVLWIHCPTLLWNKNCNALRQITDHFNYHLHFKSWNSYLLRFHGVSHFTGQVQTWKLYKWNWRYTISQWAAVQYSCTTSHLQPISPAIPVNRSAIKQHIISRIKLWIRERHYDVIIKFKHFRSDLRFNWNLFVIRWGSGKEADTYRKLPFK